MRYSQVVIFLSCRTGLELVRKSHLRLMLPKTGSTECRLFTRGSSTSSPTTERTKGRRLARVEVGLSWRPPTSPLGQVQLVLAYRGSTKSRRGQIAVQPPSMTSTCPVM
jgi:hypothetical protein